MRDSAGNLTAVLPQNGHPVYAFCWFLNKTLTKAITGLTFFGLRKLP